MLGILFPTQELVERLQENLERFRGVTYKTDEAASEAVNALARIFAFQIAVHQQLVTISRGIWVLAWAVIALLTLWGINQFGH